MSSKLNQEHEEYLGCGPRHQSSSHVTPLRKKKLKAKRLTIIVIWSAIFAYFTLTTTGEASPTGTSIQRQNNNFSSLLLSSSSSTISVGDGSTWEELDVNCTPPAIDDFPQDLYTQDGRLKGYLAIHFIAVVYVFYSLAMVCDEYFVASIECICADLKLPSDVAGATFMAVATSSPELFTNVVGTFITKGDIGLGTVVGSAVFNIFGVAACVGLSSSTALPLEWYPLTRDCFFYSLSVCLLIVYLNTRQVFWYEALFQVSVYLVYILVMYKNSELRVAAEKFVSEIRKALGYYEPDQVIEDSIPTKLVRTRRGRVLFIAVAFAANAQRHVHSDGQQVPDLEGRPPHEGLYQRREGEVVTSNAQQGACSQPSQVQAEDAEEGEFSLIHIPFNKGVLAVIHWLLNWPCMFVFGFTIPNCRAEKWRKLYPVTFIMCIVWIAMLSYVASWLVTVIGYTLSVPESVMGLTFLAAGNSIPEVVSSVIVARHGHGTMGISSSIGSNTFDILLCLGIPWLIKGIMVAKDPVGSNFVQINSEGMTYSVMALLFSLIAFYFIVACNKFYLDRKVGAGALLLYACFLVFGCLVEMNVFFPVNQPTCKSVYD